MNEIKSGCAVRAMIQVADSVIDALDFTPTEQRTVIDMANIGNRLMDALPVDYSWNESPAEIVCDLKNQIKDLSLRIAVALAIGKDNHMLYEEMAESMLVVLKMPIESLHEFIKNNPQYGESNDK